MLAYPLLQSDVELKSFTTFGIHARSRFYVRITEAGQLALLGQLPELNGLPRFVLGGGSNVILTKDYPGVVIHMANRGRECLNQDGQTVLVRAAAGEAWHEFVQWTLMQGWGGLENLSLIPGSVGAAPIQNIGAYGVEVNDYFHSLSWYEFATDTIHRLAPDQCRFAYRDSIFKHEYLQKGVILDVTFALPRRWHPRLAYGDLANRLREVEHPTPQQISDAVCAIRQSKLPDPNSIGNAGSFFKNPLVSSDHRQRLLERFPRLISYPQPGGQFKLAAGWLIEQSGWKGRVIGQVGVYEKQALVLVNRGAATGQEVLLMAKAIQADVKAQFEVDLEVEPVFV